MEKFIFDWGNGFYIGNAKEYDWPKGKTYIIQFYNDDLEKMGASLGLEFHYELQIEETNKKNIRFDCHARKYTTFVGYKGKEYSKAIGATRDTLRKKLKDLCEKSFANSDVGCKRNISNFNSLLKRDISNCDTMVECFEQCKQFMNDTYDKMLEIIKSVM